jgi:hypothetical protein
MEKETEREGRETTTLEGASWVFVVLSFIAFVIVLGPLR